MSDPQFLFDLLLLNFLPPAARAGVFLIVACFAWVFIGWYYPIENIKDPQKKSKSMYYFLLCICGILPVVLTLVGLARQNSGAIARPNVTAGVPQNIATGPPPLK
jgi:hypothetical protein